LSAPTLSDAIDEFLLARRADGLSENTLGWYSSLLSTFRAQFDDPDVASVSTAALRRYIVHLRESDYAPDTIYAHIKALHALFKWLAEEYEIKNPMKHIAYPKQPPTHQPKRAQDSDIVRMLAVCGEDAQGVRDRAIIGFLTDTGCRAAGLVGLTLEHLNLEHRRAYVREKGQKWRMVFFSAATAAFLEAWLAMHEPGLDVVFYNTHLSSPLTVSGLYQITRRIARAAGVEGPVNPHAFRHRFGVQFMLSGGDSGVLQQIMGHSDVQTTISRYGQMSDQQLAAAHRKVKPLFKPGKIE
jgi:site-specific recombinase XerD